MRTRAGRPVTTINLIVIATITFEVPVMYYLSLYCTSALLRAQRTFFITFSTNRNYILPPKTRTVVEYVLFFLFLNAPTKRFVVVSAFTSEGKRARVRSGCFLFQLLLFPVPVPQLTAGSPGTVSPSGRKYRGRPARMRTLLARSIVASQSRTPLISAGLE